MNTLDLLTLSKEIKELKRRIAFLEKSIAIKEQIEVENFLRDMREKAVSSHRISPSQIHFGVLVK